MKTSTKILLAGLAPVVLFAAVNVALNRPQAERAARQVEELSAALDPATVRTVDIRGPLAAKVLVFQSDGRSFFDSGATIPSADWLSRTGDTLIVDLPAGSVHMILPAVETVIRNGSAETVEDYQP
jgi:hypothetical protein